MSLRQQRERSGQVTVIDPATDSVVGIIRVGARPRGIQVSPNGRTLDVALSDDDPFTTSREDAIMAVHVPSLRVLGRYDAG